MVAFRKIRCAVVPVPASRDDRASDLDPFVVRLIQKLQEEVRAERRGRVLSCIDRMSAPRLASSADELDPIEQEDWYGVFEPLQDDLQDDFQEIANEAELPWYEGPVEGGPSEDRFSEFDGNQEERVQAFSFRIPRSTRIPRSAFRVPH